MTSSQKPKARKLSKEEAIYYRRMIDSSLMKELVITKQPEGLHYIIPQHTFNLIIETLDRTLKSL